MLSLLIQLGLEPTLGCSQLLNLFLGFVELLLRHSQALGCLFALLARRYDRTSA